MLYHWGMKQLSDDDILQMIGNECVHDNAAVKRAVRNELKLSKRIPAQIAPTPEHVILDLHMKTIEQAWESIIISNRDR